MFGVNPAVSVSPFLQRLLMVLALIAFSGAGYSQATDTTAPIIELEELSDGVADQSQVFTVLITEETLLKDATLYYRREGQLPFTPARMEALGSTGYFSVSIPTDPTDLRTIEYYVQARDEAGNRTVSGFAFDPYQRTLRPTPDALSSVESSTPEPTAVPESNPNQDSLLSKRWVQISLGVIAVGVIATLADQDDGEDRQLVPLTFNLQ